MKGVTLTGTGERITVIDALRGFSLIGICLIHAMQHFGAMGTMWPETFFPGEGSLNEIFSWLIRYLVFGKFARADRYTCPVMEILLQALVNATANCMFIACCWSTLRSLRHWE